MSVVRGYDCDLMEDWVQEEEVRGHQHCGCLASLEQGDGVCARCMLPVLTDTVF